MNASSASRNSSPCRRQRMDHDSPATRHEPPSGGFEDVMKSKLDEMMNAAIEQERRRLEMLRPTPLQAAIARAIADEKERWERIEAAQPRLVELAPRRRLVSVIPIPSRRASAPNSEATGAAQ